MLNAGQPSTEDIFRLQKSCLCLNIPHFHDSIEYETLLPCKTLFSLSLGRLRVRIYLSNFFLRVDWPQLPALPDPEEEDDTLEDEDLDSMDGDGSPRRQGGGQHQPRNPSGPKARDPYENDDSTAMLPIFVAIGAFIPLVFCMCRL